MSTISNPSGFEADRAQLQDYVDMRVVAEDPFMLAANLSGVAEAIIGVTMDYYIRNGAINLPEGVQFRHFDDPRSQLGSRLDVTTQGGVGIALYHAQQPDKSDLVHRVVLPSNAQIKHLLEEERLFWESPAAATDGVNNEVFRPFHVFHTSPKATEKYYRMTKNLGGLLLRVTEGGKVRR